MEVSPNMLSLLLENKQLQTAIKEVILAGENVSSAYYATQVRLISEAFRKAEAQRESADC